VHDPDAAGDGAHKRLCLGSNTWVVHSAAGEEAALGQLSGWPERCSSLQSCWTVQAAVSNRAGSSNSSRLPKGCDVLMCGLCQDGEEVVIGAGELIYGLVRLSTAYSSLWMGLHVSLQAPAKLLAVSLLA
jgi:hypothetical protein